MRDSANLDFLRSCAVLSVALSHFYSYCGIPKYAVIAHNIGVGGVAFFFVHTSLVLFLSMERTRSPRLAIDFYVKRFFRIYPLCWLCIAVVLSTGLSDEPVAQLHSLGLRGVTINAALLQNFFQVPNVIGPLWSLPWEVQMYSILPFLYVIVTQKDKNWFPLTIWAGLTICAVVFTLPAFPRAFHPAAIPPMFLGGIVAYQMRNRQHVFKSFFWPVSVLSLIVFRTILLHGDNMESSWNAGVNAFICLLLGLSIPMFSEIRSRPLTASSKQVAKYSYGIYLFHVPILALVFGHLPQIPMWGKVAAFFFITGVVSVTVFHLLEEPCVRLGRKLASGLSNKQKDHLTRTTVDGVNAPLKSLMPSDSAH
jgi:peptidoglycan/LPS O-acetylase OafA/YrhL